ncbi:MAG: hypothetical protein C0429_15190 [Sphingopyxis sp.]|nr:hypothetical protein [Sphingopyxis sp.]
MSAAALLLICMGGGTAIKPDSVDFNGSQSGTYDYGQGQYSGSVDGTITGTRTQEYADQVDVEIDGSAGRIRLPRVVLPIVRGGKDGWFELRSIKITDRTIEGEAGVNFLNRPRVHIDRLTGTISITGKGGNFTGKCERVEANATPKF